MDPQISAFLLHGIETGAFDFSVYTDVYDLKIVVNQGNEGAMRQLIEKYKLIFPVQVHRIVEHCLPLDGEVINEFDEPLPDPNDNLLKKTAKFWNRTPRIDPSTLGPFAKKRLLDYGPTIDRITDGIVSGCPGYSRLEAFIIAWVVTDTFLHTAENKSRLDNFKSTGRVERKCWITQRDEKVRRAHQLIERQEVSVFDPFIVDDEPLLYPGDPRGSFENILLCRCYMLPIT